MNLQKLKAVLDADAYGLDWANDADDAHVATEINTETVAAVKDVKNRDVQLWAAGDVLEAIDVNQTDGASAAIRGLCKAAMIWYTNQNDYKRDLHWTLLQSLQAAGVLTTDQINALNDQADTTETIGHKEGLGVVTAKDIKWARSL